MVWDKQITIKPRLSWISAAITCIFTGFLILSAISGRDAFFLPIDLGVWLDDIHALTSCISRDGHEACSMISKFPAGYLANSALVQPLRLSNGDPRPGMLILQLTALCLPIPALFSIARSLRSAIRNSGAYLAILALTPIPGFYARSGALEVQSGVFIGLALAFGLTGLKTHRLRWQLQSNACLFLGCLYKDTISIAFILAVLVSSLASGKRAPSPGELFKMWGPGLLAAVLASVFWNLVRYHHFLPLGYLEEATLNRPSVDQALTSLWALYLSPNGGLVVFWGSGLAIVLTLIAVQREGCDWLSFQRTMPLTLLLIGVSSMALWWAPFGWVAWGARLSIPFVLGAIIGAIGTLGNEGTISRQTQANLRYPTPTGRLERLVTAIAAGFLLAASIHYIALGYTHDHASFFEERRTAAEGNPSAGKHSTTSKSCTERMFDEMETQIPAHPSLVVRMWRTKSYWKCIKAGMTADPTKTP